MLIFDLSSGTFDVSVQNLQDDVFEVKSKAGNTHLDGENFDKHMANHLIDEFRCKHKKDVASNKPEVLCVQTACEKAKYILFLC